MNLIGVNRLNRLVLIVCCVGVGSLLWYDFELEFEDRLLISLTGALAVGGIWAAVFGGRREAPKSNVEVTGNMVVYTWPDGKETLDLTTVGKIDIVTTSGGPWFEDWFWVLTDGDGEEFWIGSETEGESVLSDALKAWPGFSMDEFGKSVRSTDDARFPVWRRDGTNPDSQAAALVNDP